MSEADLKGCREMENYFCMQALQYSGVLAVPDSTTEQPSQSCRSITEERTLCLSNARLKFLEEACFKHMRGGPPPPGKLLSAHRAPLISQGTLEMKEMTRKYCQEVLAFRKDQLAPAHQAMFCLGSSLEPC